MYITEMEIHTMRISDLDEIKENLIEDFDDFWNYEIFKEELANNNSRYLVLRYNNEIVCYGGIKLILDEADVMNIVTKKDKRNMGFAKFILNELIAIAKEENCKQITLEVNENNKPAIHLYESFNFKQVGLRKKYYNGTDNAILMTLKF
jgi:ribosomal-protein-alanine N-acetyltransferase